MGHPHELRAQLQHNKHEELRETAAQFERRIRLFEIQKQTFEEQLVEQRREVARFGGSSIEVMVQAEIEELDDILGMVSKQLQIQEIESRRPLRISLWQKASRPKTPDENSRLAITILAAVLGFLVPMFGIIGWRLTRRVFCH